MSRITKFAWLFTAAIMLSLTACGTGATPAPTIDPGAVYTAAVETAYSQLTLTALSVTNTPEATPILPTETLEVTNTPLATGVPINTAPALTALPTNTPFSLTPIAPTQQSCDNFLFIGDVTVPDGSHLNPDEVFDKTWKVQNTGPCSWNGDYLIGFGWGTPSDPVAWMGNKLSARLTSTSIKPGETVEITLTLHAPHTAGDYFAAFRLQNDRGAKFGIALTVVIKVP
jgi:hypothetical protein